MLIGCHVKCLGKKPKLGLTLGKSNLDNTRRPLLTPRQDPHQRHPVLDSPTPPHQLADRILFWFTFTVFSSSLVSTIISFETHAASRGAPCPSHPPPPPHQQPPSPCGTRTGTSSSSPSEGTPRRPLRSSRLAAMSCPTSSFCTSTGPRPCRT